jgi:hypothetical protein
MALVNIWLDMAGLLGIELPVWYGKEMPPSTADA